MPTVDVHTHLYPPLYTSLLRSRTTVPYIFPSPTAGDRLVILPGEDTSSPTRGRPIAPSYHSISHKLSFMSRHGIDISVLSLANPWLDWLPPAEAGSVAREVNDDMDATCGQHPGKLFFFATLPLSASVEEIVAETRRVARLKYCRGVILGTSGLGNGLDDARLDGVWQALAEENLVVFLHPHYGLPGEVYGPRAGEYGHVLPLALGFPLETTIAVTRMLLSGVFERFERLQVLLAHSGGTLPFLAGRIESCILHDGHLSKEGKIEGRRKVWDVLRKNIYLDAVIYGEPGLKAAIDVSGSDRLMFGTDHPFFPPLGEDEDEEWLSVKLNSQAVQSALGGDKAHVEAVMGGNAVKILRLS
ncbi:uracil-5-carboxylate decarboxylase [Myriangium duriaei CBS 260.36]|uniref:Uracil-5-carboxylate decarboxylase n=1 Tax=Myriangium duriaei CBS 260.36 TaxID=1168546 RepID=A0A9P4MCR0_9PEZI|nr:uracil-5-carboxylate decarboxylase [Myriangium duriaei CBS 260.36]